MGALITVDDVKTNYPILAPNSRQAELIRQNLGGDAVTVADLDRVKVPAGGATSWAVTTVDGETSEKAIEGIILHVARRRAYWDNPNPTNEQPDCSSSDCVTGVGTPGGACLACPMNQFGTAKKQGGGAGRGKACKESTLLFLLRPGQAMPLVVTVPPGSLKVVKNYLVKMASEKAVAYFGAVTRLELTKVLSRDGIGYSQIKPTFVGPLPPEAADQVQSVAALMREMFESASVDREDAEEVGEV